jgi:hypothetical protein|tara:strand:+ start:296 stop:904 length:609 start_codon:yes stop_codon:yes gene_type:complete
MGYSSDIQVQFMNDETTADPDYFVTAARPNTAATLAQTIYRSDGGATTLTVTTTGTGDNAKTNTVVGTDIFGNAVTEVITSTGSAEAVAGSTYFKTITSITSSAQFAANITVGFGDTKAHAVNSGDRVRLKGYSIVSGGTAGIIDFIDGTPESGSVLFKAQTIGTDHTTIDNTIPEQGILFKDGLSIKYTKGTIAMMSFFFA